MQETRNKTPRPPWHMTCHPSLIARPDRLGGNQVPMIVEGVMPTRRTDRQVSSWTRGQPKRNSKTRGGSIKKIEKIEEKAGRGKHEPHQEAVESIIFGRSSGEDRLLKKPGAQGKDEPIVPPRPPMANESGRSDLMRRGGKRRGKSE